MSKHFYVLESQDQNGSFYGIYRGPAFEDPFKRKFYFRSNSPASEGNAMTMARVYLEGYIEGQKVKPNAPTVP